MMNDIGKIPPQAVDLEESLLGSCLVENRILDEIVGLIKTETFYKQSNQNVWNAIHALYAENKGIDINTVSAQMQKNKTLEESGGKIYLVGLTNNAVFSGNSLHYAKILIQKQIAREVIHLTLKANSDAYDNSIDVDDVLTELNRGIEKIYDTVYQGNGLIPISEVSNACLKELEEREKRRLQGGIVGIPTPVKKLTSLTNGWQNSDFIVVAGRPSMGKTAFALSCIRQANTKVALFSLEMSNTKLVDRMLIGSSGIVSDNYRAGYLIEGDWKKLEIANNEISKLEVFIDDSPGVTIDYIAAKCRILKRKKGLGMIVIDYIQLIEDRERGLPRELQVSKISRRCKKLARELNVPVIALSQLNRSVEDTADKRPRLSHLRESGAIEQDADIVLFVYRAEKYGIMEDDHGNDTRGKGELIVEKHRNGPTGMVYFSYNESLTEIFDKKDSEIPFPDDRIEGGDGKGFF